MLKVYSGPGRLNLIPIDILQHLGYIFNPGVTNITGVTQETYSK